ncbi:MAG TPA: UDP-N-acetylmuramate dehydrogenase [Candidatus Paceibacterota bacterium]|jgi:UDP-N-acetylmuramate dehydrogenase
MNVQEDIPLAPRTTFRMGPVAQYLIEIGAVEDLPKAFAFIREKGLPFVVLGGGSNTIFTMPERYEGVVLDLRIPGFELGDDGRARIGAGEEWDSVVARAVIASFSGIESLSAIPGRTGATPIQNVGAYGTEIADVLENVEVYEHETGSVHRLTREECGFSYRDSIFKHDARYVITHVTLRLSKETPTVPDYPGVKAYFEKQGIGSPTLRDIRTAIIDIRKTKLPDPRDLASVGSFFKNPIVPASVAERFISEFEKPVVFGLPDGTYKVGAGWLIDLLGLKGKSFGNLSLYPQNALVVVNNGEATYEELAELISDIQGMVRERFGITLEPEPVFV